MAAVLSRKKNLLHEWEKNSNEAYYLIRISLKTYTISCYKRADFITFYDSDRISVKSVCVSSARSLLWSLIMSSRAPLTFRHWTRSCFLCMGSTRGRGEKWIATEGVGEKEGGIGKGKRVHCWMLSRSKTGGVLGVFIPIHSNAGIRMSLVSLKQTLWVTEMLSVSCLDTSPPLLILAIH